MLGDLTSKISLAYLRGGCGRSILTLLSTRVSHQTMPPRSSICLHRSGRKGCISEQSILYRKLCGLVKGKEPYRTFDVRAPALLSVGSDNNHLVAPALGTDFVDVSSPCSSISKGEAAAS